MRVRFVFLVLLLYGFLLWLLYRLTKLSFDNHYWIIPVTRFQDVNNIIFIILRGLGKQGEPKEIVWYDTFHVCRLFLSSVLSVFFFLFTLTFWRCQHLNYIASRVEQMMNDELKMIWKKSWLNEVLYLDLPEGTGENRKNLSQNSRCPGRD
jgi:hypothetical protein